MSDETQELLERVLALEEENNKMLRKIRSHARWSALFSFVYWAVILGSSAAAFYYIQPYLIQLVSAYQSLAEASKKAGTILPSIDTKSLEELNNTLKNFRSGQ